MVPYGGQAPARLARFALLAICPSLAGGNAAAQLLPDAPQPGSRPLEYQTGKVSVLGSAKEVIATIDLPEGWRYLQQADARAVIERRWGNRPNPGTLGLVLPPSSWGGIVVTYDARGQVRDDGAHELDADALLETMREDLAAGNPARARAGQPAIELLGWAEPPNYDPARKTLSWARAMRLADGGKPILNYDIRLLGADGILVMQAVADLADQQQVVAGAHAVLEQTELAPGLRYDAHDPSRHKIATSGLTELISGKRVSASLFRLLLRVLIAAGVVVIGVRLGRR